MWFIYFWIRIFYYNNIYQINSLFVYICLVLYFFNFFFNFQITRALRVHGSIFAELTSQQTNPITQALLLYIFQICVSIYNFIYNLNKTSSSVECQSHSNHHKHALPLQHTKNSTNIQHATPSTQHPTFPHVHPTIKPIHAQPPSSCQDQLS